MFGLFEYKKGDKQMSNENQKNLKNKRGITLIALIITIIVILILVAVTVRTVANSGLFKHAKDAVNKWSQSQEDELELANKLAEQIEDVDTPKIDDPEPGVLEGEGTEENPYLICSIEDLVALSYNTNTLGNEYEGCYFELPISLNFKSDKSYVNPNRTILQVGENVMYGSETNTVTLKEYLNTVGFTPIGSLQNVIIDGRNNAIHNLYIHNSNSSSVGFFKQIECYDLPSNTYAVQNLTMTGKIEIDENYTGSYENSNGKKRASASGMVGSSYCTGLLNCHSSVEISIKNLPDVSFAIRRTYCRRI